MNIYWHRGAVFGLLAAAATAALAAAQSLMLTINDPLAWSRLSAAGMLILFATLWYDVQRVAAVLAPLAALIVLCGSIWLDPGGWHVLAMTLATAAAGVGMLGDLITRENNQAPNLEAFYDAAVKARRIRPNPEQQQIVQRLDVLAEDHLRHESRRHLPWAPLLRAPRGVYLYGPVGRGKSFLLDGLFDVSVSRVKRRFHFHELMSELNAKVNQGSSARKVARSLAPRSSLLVIDEISIPDLATALLFSQLVLAWWRYGCVLCMSSNQAPDQLLPGAGRSHKEVAAVLRDLPDRMHVIELSGSEDYRLNKLSGADLYQYPVTEETEAGLSDIVHLLAEDAVVSDPVPVGSRKLRARMHAGGIAWFDFGALCGQPFSYDDYLHLVDRYPTLVVSDVPHLTRADEARRFAWLVEIVYDARKRLVISAHAPRHALFGADLVTDGAMDYLKIQSRLAEMQSSEYDYTLA